jgi:cysteinyl-tRNA synthetase
MSLKIYNSLTRQKEKFEPINPPQVGMYTCGPTVYSYVTIGNWRTNFLSDLVFRTLQALDYEVEHVMNITDVGHLTDDADSGEDKLEQAAKKERKTAWEIAKTYTKDFLDGLEALNIKQPQNLPRATDHIDQQINLIKQIEDQGFSYQTKDGIYFDIQKYEQAGHDYGQLSSLDQIKAGARVEKNPEKKDPRDFALWKFSPEDKKRDMEWDSPWGKGFPGWHIECSAMSMAYLGEQFDIHIGGEDLKSTHHPNEIAQSESATGKSPFVKYWIHGAFLMVEGGKMSKSLGNQYTLQDIEAKGFHPLDLRYFYLTGHYRKQLNFTWEALKNAQQSRLKLQSLVPFKVDKDKKTDQAEKLYQEFIKHLSDDFNAPQALAVFWQAMKNEKLSPEEKKWLTKKAGPVLGLNLLDGVEVPEKVKELAQKREELRQSKQWDQADKARQQIEDLGYKVEDTSAGPKIIPIN